MIVQLQWLLLRDAMDATATFEDRHCVDEHHFAVWIRPLQYGHGLGIIGVVKAAQDDAAIDNIMVDVGVVHEALLVGDLERCRHGNGSEPS